MDIDPEDTVGVTLIESVELVITDHNLYTGRTATRYPGPWINSPDPDRRTLL